MWVLRCHAPVSIGTFIKHLPSSFRPRRISSTVFAQTPKPPKSSCFHALSSRQKEQVQLYVDALLQWNQRMNLTSTKEVEEVMERHIEDSLAMIPPIQEYYIPDSRTSAESLSLVDVGSGPGLPGLVLAIAYPGWKVTLVESMTKRCAFLEYAVSLTRLSNVEVVKERAEKIGQDHRYRERFDVAVARAVAEMGVLAEYCLPLVRVGGLFVAAKGHDPHEEVGSAEKVIQLMGASAFKICAVESHSPFGQRTAILCLKDRTTPQKYPRDPGIPTKVPLQ